MPQGVVNPQLSRQATGGSNMLNTLRALISLLPGAFPPEAGRGSSLRPETEAPLNEPSLQDVPLTLLLGGLLGKTRGAEVFGEDLISALRRALRTQAVLRKDAQRVEEVGEEGLSELERFFRQREADVPALRARAPERVEFGERTVERLGDARTAGKLPVDIVLPDDQILPELLSGGRGSVGKAARREIQAGVERLGTRSALRIGDPITLRPPQGGTMEYFVVPWGGDEFAVVQRQVLEGIDDLPPFPSSEILSIHPDRGSAIARAQADVIQTVVSTQEQFTPAQRQRLQPTFSGVRRVQRLGGAPKRPFTP